MLVTISFAGLQYVLQNEDSIVLFSPFHGRIST